MTTNYLMDIVIAPNAKLTEELTQKVAAILCRGLYHTRTLLTSKIPMIVTKQTDLHKIEDILHRIENLGLVSFSCKDAELQKPLRLFKANTLEFTDNNIIFKDKNAQLFRLESNNVFLILKGIKRTFKEKEVVTKIKKLNITATLLTGGIPIRRTIQERTTETTTQDEIFIRLFEKNSVDFCLEIRQYGFNYSCLGSDMSPSSLYNINLIAKKIKEFFPEAVFNDKLGEFPLANISPTSPRDNIDIDCKLIYLYQVIKSHRSD